MTAHVPALVIGAGISGLVCAYALRRAGIDAQVVEASAKPGGVIATERRDGYMLEFGPQSFAATSSILSLCRELQIEAVGLSGVAASLVQAHRRPPVKLQPTDTDTVDFGFVGDIDRINTDVIRKHLDNGLMPVISPLSADAGGQLLNINADTAQSLATMLEAAQQNPAPVTNLGPGVGGNLDISA